MVFLMKEGRSELWSEKRNRVRNKGSVAGLF